MGPRKKEEEAIQCFIQELLSQELSVDQAVQIALLNNPKIQAAFEEIGVARADLIQAGLLSNPLFEGIVRFPLQHNARTNIDLLAIQNF
ncbi:MAG: hypothetical protein HWD61_05805 [Parachlamydiaceae bacterium]|nr:MAG: hypothetical protein HWD61_05805 [Parachlamydiaceae bacterium]